MALPIEDYAIIADTQTAALVGRNGAIDWLCVPRFDSGAIFAALLGDAENGHWTIRPAGEVLAVRRRYRHETLVLETEFETADGVVKLIDFMPPRGEAPDVVRIVEGVRGTVPMTMELRLRFDYGQVVPWVYREHDALVAVAGPDAVWLRTPVETRGENMSTSSDFEVSTGDRTPFVLTWRASHLPPPAPIDPIEELGATEGYWRGWVSACTYDGEWRDAVVRSLLTLKALTYAPTGGIVAAATTSLPEKLGGVRNWDYRFCWLRDATITLQALLFSGFQSEATAWRKWLLRAIAGNPAELQIMYGVAGERRLVEFELPSLPGYENSSPVRIGNAAAAQIQLDVYGEVLGALYVARRAGLPANEVSWALECALLKQLETIWHEPDDGIWEVRSGRQQFTHSKVMAWVAFDRAIASATEFGLKGPVAHWREVREAIHQQVCTHGYDAEQNSFVQSYGSTALDASLLLIPMVGFLPATDERVRGTVAAIERNLVREGLVIRYDTHEVVDGLPSGEGAFLACSFWLVDNYVLQGRLDEAHALFERLLSFRNDVGLLAEEYDPVAKRQLGNFPQAFSHLALINSAQRLARHAGKPPSPANSTAQDGIDAFYIA